MSDTTAPTDRPQRRRWTWIILGLAVFPIGLIVWLRASDATGDQGMTNAFTMMLSIVTLGIVLLWLLVTGAFRRRTRLLSLTAILLAVVAFFGLFRMEAVTGTLVPVLTPRWKSAEPLGLETAVVAESAGDVDLVTTTPHDFPGYLGPRRDMRALNVTLARDWDAQPPKLLWRQPIGLGWSGFAVVNGVAVTMEERGEQQMVTAYDVATGALLWEHHWPGTFDHSAGGPGPRCTPYIDDGRVYAIGPRGRLVCLDGADGTPTWSIDLLDAYGIDPAADAVRVVYGRSNSPLVHGNMLIVPVGPNDNLVAFDKVTGDEIWSGSNRQISYSSPQVATLGGVEQVLIVNERSVTGHDLATGRELWSHAWPGSSAADSTASQAVPLPPSDVLVSRGYGTGAARLALEPSGDDGSFAVNQLWHVRRSMRTKFTNAVIHEGYAYGLSDGILECIDLANGDRMWKGGRYGHGQILGVGDVILVLSEDGEVVMVEATPETTNEVLGRFDGIDGLTWNTFALYGDVLLIRNGREAAAYRLPVVE